MGATKYVSVKHPRAKYLERYPNAGPNPCIAGMRKLYWGKDAWLIRCGQYVYKVPREVWFSY